MEGPAFSTRAESEFYRAQRFDIIGMTNLQEAKLAREAEICYVTIALVTDYDCWHPDHDHVTVDMVVANLLQNAVTAQHVIANAVESLPIARTCGCGSALTAAIITHRDAIPEATRRELEPIVGKYFT
jgi:5'-methylthioadenosine phosphorylase